MNGKENICVNKTPKNKWFWQTNKKRSHVIGPKRKSLRVAETGSSRLEFKATRVSSSLLLQRGALLAEPWFPHLGSGSKPASS